MMNEIKALVGIIFIVAVLFGTSNSCYAASHDVAWSFFETDLEFASYNLVSVEPSYIDIGQIGAENPDMILQLGKRYQVTVTNFNFHPFEVIAKGATALDDTVLLSQGLAVGSFEGDNGVDWLGDGTSTVTFTLTSGLYNAMIASGKTPGYRCWPHALTMRGNFVICTVPLLGDLNEDCEVNFIDFALMAANWLECNPEACL